MIGIDWTVHVSDLITPVGLGLIGLILHRVIRPVRNFVEKVNLNERRIEDTAEVVDQHSDIFRTAGWIKTPLRVVSQKRRQHDEEEYR